MKTVFLYKSCSLVLLTVVLISLASVPSFSQWVPAPGKAQEKPVYIVGGTIHVGNGLVIEKGTVVFDNGKISAVTNTVESNIDEDNAEVINAEGKHVYPGLISPNTLNGLVEINALRPTRDYNEVGNFKPHLRTIIAYNTDSWVTPTVRSNGVLISQIRPQGGRIPGTSAIVQMDAWNYEDAVIKEEDGIIVNFPVLMTRGGWWAEPGKIKENEKYFEQLNELKSFFAEAKAYSELGNVEEVNLKFEAMKGVFDKTKKVYINANHSKAIISAIDFINEFDVDGIIVGGRDAWMITDLLKENEISIILNRTHSMPFLADDDIDLPFKMPKILKDAGINFCMMAENLSGEQRNLPFTAGKAVAYGLSKEEALMSITSSAAKILGIDDRLGSLEVGKDATLVISSGDILDPVTNNIEKAYVSGRSVNLENKQKELYRKFMDKYGLEHKQH